MLWKKEMKIANKKLEPYEQKPTVGTVQNIL